MPRHPSLHPKASYLDMGNGLRLLTPYPASSSLLRMHWFEEIGEATPASGQYLGQRLSPPRPRSSAALPGTLPLGARWRGCEGFLFPPTCSSPAVPRTFGTIAHFYRLDSCLFSIPDEQMAKTLKSSPDIPHNFRGTSLGQPWGGICSKIVHWGKLPALVKGCSI